MTIYKKSYSTYYDILYKDKDYKSETDFISDVLKKYSSGKGRKLLSLGCGTCNYELLLAKGGYEITGIDRSGEMLGIAVEKIKAAKLESKIKLLEKDVRNFSFREEYDSCMAMFNIVGYQIKNEDFEKMLKNINYSLKKGGTFIFDCWYMPAVLKDMPTDRVKKVKTENGELVRLTKSLLDIKNNVIEINFDVMEKIKGKNFGETKETHLVRYWSFPELKYFLTKAGFSVLKVCNFMDEASEISSDNWNIFVVARRLQ